MSKQRRKKYYQKDKKNNLCVAKLPVKSIKNDFEFLSSAWHFRIR